MIAVATDIGDKINHELRSYGANLVVTPQEDTLDVEVGGVNLKPPSDGTFLNEADLPKIRGTFWHHNIVGFSPMLPVTVKLGIGSTARDVTLVGTYFNKQLSFGKEEFTTGVRITHPWWKVEGCAGVDDPAVKAKRQVQAMNVDGPTTTPKTYLWANASRRSWAKRLATQSRFRGDN